MANIDRNFLARPDFVVSTGENGKALTLTARANSVFSGDFEHEKYDFDGYHEIQFAADAFVYGMILGHSDGNVSGLLQVSPQCTDNVEIVNQEASEQLLAFIGTYNFWNFVRNNPVHISRLNVRCKNQLTMPTQIEILYPNIFDGQSEKRIIDLASKKTAYQYQDGIITIDNADFLLTRNCTIRLTGCPRISNDDWDSEGAVEAANLLYLDITIDKYLSLEKALVENLKLM